MHKKIQGINTQLKKNNKEEYNKIFKQVTHPNQLIILNALVNSDALSKSIFGQTIDAVEKDKKYLQMGKFQWTGETQDYEGRYSFFKPCFMENFPGYQGIYTPLYQFVKLKKSLDLQYLVEIIKQKNQAYGKPKFDRSMEYYSILLRYFNQYHLEPDLTMLQGFDIFSIQYMTPLQRNAIREQNKASKTFRAKYFNNNFNIFEFAKNNLDRFIFSVSWRWIGQYHTQHYWVLVTVRLLFQYGVLSQSEIQQLMIKTYTHLESLKALENRLDLDTPTLGNYPCFIKEYKCISQEIRNTFSEIVLYFLYQHMDTSFIKVIFQNPNGNKVSIKPAQLKLKTFLPTNVRMIIEVCLGFLMSQQQIDITQLATQQVKDISYRLLKFYTTQQDEYFFGLELINTTQMKLSYRYNANQNKDFLKLYEILRETFVKFASGAYYQKQQEGNQELKKQLNSLTRILKENQLNIVKQQYFLFQAQIPNLMFRYIGCLYGVLRKDLLKQIFSILIFCFKGNQPISSLLFSQSGIENLLSVIDTYPYLVFKLFFNVIKSIKRVKIHNYLLKQLVLKLNNFLENQKNSVRYLAVVNYYLQLLKLLSRQDYKHYDDIPLGIPYLQTLKEFHMACDKIERCYNRKLSNAKDLLIKYEPVIDFTVNLKLNWESWDDDVRDDDSPTFETAKIEIITSYLDLLTSISEQECLYSIYILVINMKVEIFEAINSSNYYRFNLMVLKVFTIFYYYPKQSLMNMREEQDEAEYNEKTTAGQDANIAEQFLYKLIEREYKDQVKGSIQDIKQYVQEGIINFYLKKLMFSNSFQDKIRNNTKNELLELVKQMSKNMDGLLQIAGIEITAKLKNFMNIIQIQVEEMTENTKYQTIIKAGLQIALLFLNMNKEHPLLKKYNIKFDGYEYLVWEVYAQHSQNDYLKQYEGEEADEQQKLLNYCIQQTVLQKKLKQKVTKTLGQNLKDLYYLYKKEIVFVQIQKKQDHPLLRWITYEGLNSDHISNFIVSSFKNINKWKFFNPEYLSVVEILTKIISWNSLDTQMKLLQSSNIEKVVNTIFLNMKVYFALTVYRYPRNIYWQKFAKILMLHLKFHMAFAKNNLEIKNFFRELDIPGDKFNRIIRFLSFINFIQNFTGYHMRRKEHNMNIQQERPELYIIDSLQFDLINEVIKGPCVQNQELIKIYDWDRWNNNSRRIIQNSNSVAYFFKDKVADYILGLLEGYNPGVTKLIVANMNPNHYFLIVKQQLHILALKYDIPMVEDFTMANLKDLIKCYKQNEKFKNDLLMCINIKYFKLLTKLALQPGLSMKFNFAYQLRENAFQNIDEVNVENVGDFEEDYGLHESDIVVFTFYYKIVGKDFLQSTFSKYRIINFLGKQLQMIQTLKEYQKRINILANQNSQVLGLQNLQKQFEIIMEQTEKEIQMKQENQK